MSLSTEQIRGLAGRLVLGRIPALTLDHDHKNALQQGTMGGITLFKENASDLDQLAQLTDDIIQSSHHLPVLAVDQEGGAVQRFDQVLSPLPSPMALAALDLGAKKTGTAEQTSVEIITEISCRQLKKLGLNMLLAPTLDLQTNARNPIICTRAYGDDGLEVSAIASRIIKTIESSGLIAVGKHFPGHGSTDEDSHLQLARVDKSEAALLASDMVPFAQLKDQLQAILIGHIWLPQLVPDQCPATLSKKVVGGLLQDKLNFAGLIVSDDMIMKAITHGFGLGEACVLALLAGVDLLLVCGTIFQSMEAVEAIVQATLSGRVSEERLLQAAARIDSVLKTKTNTHDNQQTIKAADKNKLAKFQEEIDCDTTISAQISGRAISIISGKLAQIDLKTLADGATITIVAPQHSRYPINLAADLKLLLNEQVHIVDLRYQINPDENDRAEIIAQIEAGPVIFLTYRSAINKGQTDLAAGISAHLQELTKGGNLSAASLIHVAIDSPYDITFLPQLRSAEILSLATFDPSCQAISALAAVLTGEIEPVGLCPVKLALPAHF